MPFSQQYVYFWSKIYQQLLSEMLLSRKCVELNSPVQKWLFMSPW